MFFPLFKQSNIVQEDVGQVGTWVRLLNFYMTGTINICLNLFGIEPDKGRGNLNVKIS